MALGDVPGGGHRATSWLSCDLTQFADELRLHDAAVQPALHFDVVVVGSGYGGAAALRELAGWGASADRPLRIAVLERGNEYLPGAFPARLSDLPGHVRFASSGFSAPRGRPEGLFDLRIGPDMAVLVGNGLGGGSLVNAGVMARPVDGVFDEAVWPQAIRDDALLRDDAAWNDLRDALGATVVSADPRRRAAMQAVAGATPVADVWATVAAADDAARAVQPCNGCGDCATGCNFGAKRSLDVTLLADAAAEHPAGALRIVTGATAVALAPLESSPGSRAASDWPWPGFEVSVRHTAPHLAERQAAPYRLRAAIVILAAGTLGSTELLLRSHGAGLPLSPCLGSRFSGNGDTLFGVAGLRGASCASADDRVAPEARRLGPTITAMIDRRGDGGFVVQDLGIPAPLRRVFEETITTVGLVDSLTRFDASRHLTDDPAAIDRARVDACITLAVIGRDDADGRLRLPHGDAGAEPGTLVVDWPQWRQDRRPEQWQSRLADGVASGATVFANPLWRPLPAKLERLLGRPRGPMITVHPLGGCAMADSSAAGVVNHLGQVFCCKAGPASGARAHPNLLVLDGSVVPTSLGINPSLTIAMLARRAVRALRGVDHWRLVRTTVPPARWAPRPVFRAPTAAATSDPAAGSTELELTEQMHTRVWLPVDGRRQPCRVEVQLWTQPFGASDLIFGRAAPRELAIDGGRSRLRVYRPAAAEPPRVAIVSGALPAPPALWFEASVSGTMRLLRQARRCGTWRALATLWVFGRNRALRDAVRWAASRLQGHSAGTTLGEAIGALWRLGSSAGQQRLIEYELQLGAGSASDGKSLPFDIAGATLRAVKTLSYSAAASPLVQLMQARVTEAPAGWRVAGPLAVDPTYFAAVGVPLLRIVRQADAPSALTEVGSLLMYVLRAVLPLHALTLRLPDTPPPADGGGIGIADSEAAAAHRLPGPLPGLPAPEIHTLRIGREAALRLARYRSASPSQATPVLMIHGYSASGTTFAHERLPEGGLAGYLARRGHDVWVLDLRSSAGMPTAQKPWDFEEIGCQDIPLAVDAIVQRTGRAQVDVVAHCMGAAMLSLGLFGDWARPPVHGKPIDLYPALRERLPQRLRRIVFSQVGPVVAMSPMNTARAWLFAWLVQVLPFGRFEFDPRRRSRSDDLLDSLLQAVPYPAGDFWRENPPWPPWQRTPWAAVRHRMDALYGITFSLARIDAPVLERIDDFFGPLNLRTVAQVIAFARDHQVADRAGCSGFIARRFDRIAHCRVLGLHAAENGLIDISTRRLLFERLLASGIAGESVRLENAGHQDSLIGRQAGATFSRIASFLQQD